jgi:methionine-S-sulfoxide reductase
MEVIYLAAGCFWGVEAILKRQEGVISTEVGYLGGQSTEPSYREVCTGSTGHAEVVEVKYDANKISTEKLLNIFWRLHDPTQLNRQGVDVGTQYRSGIFYTTEEQKIIAEKSKAEFDSKNSFGKSSVTEITKASEFWKGEDYHQDYFDKNPGHICHTLRDSY